MNKHITRKACAMCKNSECLLLIKGKARCYSCNFYISKREFLIKNGCTYEQMIAKLGV